MTSLAASEKPKRGDDVSNWVLFATISASSMGFIGGSALNVALPAIQRDLGATGADLLWIVNAYALFLAALILVGGSLGDHLGRKRIFMIGITLFTVTSLICGLAPSTGILILARAAQGVGGALMIPGSLAIISAYFDSSERGRAIGTWSSITTLTSVLGPVLGGVLAENGLWRGVFFINIPLGLISLWALWRYVPESRDEAASDKLDYLGALLVTVGFAGITYGFIEIGRIGPEGFTNPLYVGALAVGIAGLLGFWYVEATSDHPMMPLRLFRSRTFSGANVLTLFLYGALGAALFFLPLNLVQVQGYGESLAGFALLPFSILLIVMSRWAGGLVDRYGPRLPLIVGPVIVGVAFIALSLPGQTGGPSDYWISFFPGMLLIGLGMGVTVAPLTTTVMGSVPQSNAGVASGVNNAMSRSSQVLATAVMGGIALLIFTTSLGERVVPLNLSDSAITTLEDRAEDLAATQPPAELDNATAEEVRSAIKLAFVDTFRAMNLIAAGLCFLSALLAGLLIDKRLEPPDELKREAGELPPDEPASQDESPRETQEFQQCPASGVIYEQ